MSTQSLGEQTIDLLARLVRLGCVNDLTADSGREERAADLLEEFFADLPVSIERITPPTLGAPPSWSRWRAHTRTVAARP